MFSLNEVVNAIYGIAHVSFARRCELNADHASDHGAACPGRKDQRIGTVVPYNQPHDDFPPGLQVQCVREVLLQMSSMYTDLVMRADLPASKRGVKVRKARIHPACRLHTIVVHSLPFCRVRPSAAVSPSPYVGLEADNIGFPVPFSRKGVQSIGRLTTGLSNAPSPMLGTRPSVDLSGAKRGPRRWSCQPTRVRYPLALLGACRVLLLRA